MLDLPVDWSDGLGEAFALLTGSGYWKPAFIYCLARASLTNCFQCSIRFCNNSMPSK